MDQQDKDGGAIPLFRAMAREKSREKRGKNRGPLPGMAPAQRPEVQRSGVSGAKSRNSRESAAEDLRRGEKNNSVIFSSAATGVMPDGNRHGLLRQEDQRTLRTTWLRLEV
jgi:hypothetical protein